MCAERIGERAATLDARLDVGKRCVQCRRRDVARNAQCTSEWQACGKKRRQCARELSKVATPDACGEKAGRRFTGGDIEDDEISRP